MGNREKKVSLENDKYLTLILNMLGYTDQEKTDLRAKVDKVKSTKGGFLGMFKWVTFRLIRQKFLNHLISHNKYIYFTKYFSTFNSTKTCLFNHSLFLYLFAFASLLNWQSIHFLLSVNPDWREKNNLRKTNSIHPVSKDNYYFIFSLNV